MQGQHQHIPLLLVLIMALGCVPQGRSPAGEAAPAPAPEPAIVRREISAPAAATAARLIQEARNHLEQGRSARALETARRVVEEFSAAPGSSEALVIWAESAIALEEYGEAIEPAGRYVVLFTEGDVRTDRGLLLLGRALFGDSRLREGVEAMVRMSGQEDNLADEALALIQSGAIGLTTEELEELTAQPPLGLMHTPLVVELAVARHLQGDPEGARSEAERALSLGARGDTRALAQAVVRGRVEEALQAPVIGAILPASGSPSMSRLAELIEEGMRTALARARRETRRPIRLEVLDDGGDALVQRSLVANLERVGAVAVVGPLLDRTFAAAAAARNRPVPMISPAAATIPEGVGSVYSLAGPDPGPARAVARQAVREGLYRVSAVYPRSAEAEFELREFRQEFLDQGGVMTGEVSYTPGSTHFLEHLDTAASREPQALFLPLPPRDVRVLAPQFTFFGLDSLGVRILGTAGWTADEVVKGVDSRHTDGVVAVTPHDPEQPSGAEERFVAEYESFHRKSLRSPVPALGYDAVGLVLEALKTGARTPEQVGRALERIRRYPGASGILSVRDGRVVREHYVVRFDHQTLQVLERPSM